MELLLDTHALLWWFSGSDRLSHTARTLISAPTSIVWVSAASAWEIATKQRLGRLDAGPLATDFVHQVEGQAFQVLPIDANDAQHAGGLPGPHRDPFDRILCAQALRRGLTLVSLDTAVDGWSVRRTW